MRRTGLHMSVGLLGLIIMAALAGCGYVIGSASGDLISNESSNETGLNLAPTVPATEMEDSLEVAEEVERTQGVESALALPTCFDFDLGQVTGESDPACDLAFVTTAESGEVEMVSMGRAGLAAGLLTAEPSASECSSRATEEGKSIALTQLPESGYLCYRTGEGNYGYVQLFDEAISELNIVGFEWKTFPSSASENSAQAVPESTSYENSSLGFKLTLPHSWQGFQVAVHERGQGQTVCFFFEGPMPICVFQIYAFSPSEWDTLEKAPENFYLAENDSYIFATDPPQSDCIQMDDFQCERYREVPAILESFSTIK